VWIVCLCGVMVWVYLCGVDGICNVIRVEVDVIDYVLYVDEEVL